VPALRKGLLRDPERGDCGFRSNGETFSKEPEGQSLQVLFGLLALRAYESLERAQKKPGGLVMKHPQSYPYLRGDGVPVASPLFQGEGGGSIPTSPLQFDIHEIDVETAVQLNGYWHSRLPSVSYSNIVRGGLVHCYVAEFEDAYYATAIWTRPVAANRLKDGYLLLELRRLAISPQAPRNTASRMLGIMTKDLRRKEPSVIRLISYQDTEVHTGGIYKAAGWVAAHLSEFQSWVSHKDAKRMSRVDQVTSAKVRWELPLRKVA
jgi:hypothetical protein